MLSQDALMVVVHLLGLVVGFCLGVRWARSVEAGRG